MILLVLPALWISICLARIVWLRRNVISTYGGTGVRYVQIRDEYCKRMLPGIERISGKNYRMAEEIGLGWSGIFFGFVRFSLVFLTLGIGTLVNYTNIGVIETELLRDMSIGTSFVEVQSARKYTDAEIKREIQTIRIIYKNIETKRLLSEGAALNGTIQRVCADFGIRVTEQELHRISLKLIEMDRLHKSVEPWILLGIFSISIYISPLPLGWVRKEARLKRKRAEIISLYEAIMLYGELPPYEIKGLVHFLISSSHEYRHTLERILEGAKAANCEETLNQAIREAEGEKDWGMADLLEQLKSFYLSGLLTRDQALGGIIERKRKLEEIYEERRRNGKFQITAVPLAVIICMGAWYFMLGTLSLSNLATLGK